MRQQEYSVGGGTAVAIFKEVPLKGKGYIYVTAGENAAGPAVEAATEALLRAGAAELFVRPPCGPCEEQTFAAGRFRFVYDSTLLRMESELPPAVSSTNEALVFETLSPSNGQAYLALYNVCFHDVPNSATYDESDLQRLHTGTDTVAALVRINGEPAGIIEVEASGEVPSIESLGLLPQARGCGWGRLLLRSVMGRLAERGYGRVSLIVSTANQPAHQLYLSEGFHCTRVVSRWFRLAGGATL